ncbi:MAG: sulfur carrier protein ThiS [Deltaproteobacteria bacterium]|nr:sulfur carrier protein ThiS [Deltaproteobacteria bacterium]
MQISVNGKLQDVEDPTTIAGLLQKLGIDSRSVVVEKNLQIVHRAALEQETVREGDSIEIIRFVGGG